jgi:glutamate carboxypeptidase
MTSRDAAAKLLEQLPAMEATLAELVCQNSFTEHRDGGNIVGARLADLFALPGLELTRVSSERFADHLVWSSTGDSGRAPIALVGHLDTVFPPGTFDEYRRDGELRRGPGVLDMKGGLVVVAFALHALAETVGLTNLPPLRIVIVSDEEVGSPEGQGVIRHAIRDARGCLVFEAGRKDDLIITQRKGTGAIKAKAYGVAAHAGNNHRDGANALVALARFVDAVSHLTDYASGVTVNVGRMVAGETKNTVPDYAEADIDVRFTSRADADAVIARMHQLAGSCALPQTRIELGGGVARFPLERSDANVALMHAYGLAAERAALGSAEAGLIGGGSDASTAWAMGIAAIDGLGPRGIGFHTKNEQIEVVTLVQKAQALAHFLAAYRG